MIRIAICVCFFICVGIPHTASAIELTTASQQSEPKYYQLPNGLMAGLCIDIMRAIEAVDADIKFTGYQKFIPFKRLQLMLEQGQLDVFFGFKKTDKREKKFVFVDIPLYQLNYVVAVRRGDNVKIDNSGDLSSIASQGRIITVFGSAASTFLHRQKGLQVDDGAVSPALLLEKLRMKRGRFAFYHDLGLNRVIKNGGFYDDIEVLPVSFLSYSHYVAFSKKVPASTIQRLKAALEKIRNSGELAAIYKKYAHL